MACGLKIKTTMLHTWQISKRFNSIECQNWCDKIQFCCIEISLLLVSCGWICEFPPTQIAFKWGRNIYKSLAFEFSVEECKKNERERQYCWFQSNVNGVWRVGSAVSQMTHAYTTKKIYALNMTSHLAGTRLSKYTSNLRVWITVIFCFISSKILR